MLATLGASTLLNTSERLLMTAAGPGLRCNCLGKPGRDPKGLRVTTLEAGLFESGRPVLIAPPGPRPQMGTNVLIAWNCSTEQARATAFAMPILKRASRVVVLTVIEGGAAVPGPTGEQLCRYLQLNEVPAKPLTVGLDGRLTGEVILAHANALGCDLLIKVADCGK
jgi:hypothetical protein